MAELKQYAWLLSIILLLAVIKFVIVPVFTWQDEVLADISYLEKKQDKINSLLKNSKSNNRVNDELILMLTPANKLLFPLQKEASFKLKQQERIETLLAKYKLQVQHVGWQVSTYFNKLSIVRYPIEIRFTGKTLDAIDFINALEIATPHIDIRDFNFSFRGQIDKNLGRITAKITLHLYVEKNAPLVVSALQQRIPRVDNSVVDQLANSRHYSLSTLLKAV